MVQTGGTLVVSAPAKVNLSLHVLGKRSDGYHELDTVMQKLDLADTIKIQRLSEPTIQLSCPDSDLPENDTNLVWKAAAAFLRETCLEKESGVSIILEKNIPVAAGLGGGSSDAGIVLVTLNHLFGANLSEETLIRLGSPLGADVPFFVVPHCSVRAGGIGDRMKPVPALTGFSLLLVNPGFSVSTAWVYGNFTLTRADKDSNLSDSRENADTLAGFSPLYNDLETVTIEHYPEIAAIKRFLLDNGASDALMSGSGPTVFGLFPDRANGDESDLQRCAALLVEKYGRGVFVTRPLGVN
ncbi:MAG: 4-(cytidine 5'-diphospho)-2-C-methyl-D-erythritol kinase [Desulfocapsa sp.]|nr:4-(cytidine 5'-diphospho)-2-C-methyl-D-erythritol kinase [Desulfocapsa sp.]